MYSILKDEVHLSLRTLNMYIAWSIISWLRDAAIKRELNDSSLDGFHKYNFTDSKVYRHVSGLYQTTKLLLPQPVQSGNWCITVLRVVNCHLFNPRRGPTYLCERLAADDPFGTLAELLDSAYQVIFLQQKFNF